MNKRKIEIFSAGCPACNEAVNLVKKMAGPACEVQVLDMNDTTVATKAKQYAVRTVPAIAIDGKLASCCAAGGGVEEAALRAAGIGVPLP